MDAEALTESARQRRKAGDVEGALRELDEAIRLDPSFAEARLLRGVIGIDREDLAGALADLDEAIRLGPSEARAHHNRGYALELAGRTDDAIAAYERAIELDPDYARARNALDELRTRALADPARKKFDQEDYAGAARDLDEAIRIHPDSPSLLHLRGIARIRLDDPAGALADLDKTVGLDRSDARAHYNRGIALRNLGRHAEAVAAFERALEIDPTYKRAREELDERAREDLQARPGELTESARRKVDAGDLDGAARELDEAVRLDPKLASARHLRGVLRCRRNDAAGALTDLDEAIRLEPSDARAHFNRGVALDQLNRGDDALAAYRRAVEIDPKYELARKAVAQRRKPVDWGSLGCGLILAGMGAVLLYYSAKQAADVYYKAALIVRSFPPERDLCYEPFCGRRDTAMSEDATGTIIRFHACPDHRGGATISMGSGRVRLSGLVLGFLLLVLYCICVVVVSLVMVPIVGALFRIALWPVLIPMRLRGRLPPGRVLPFLHRKREIPGSRPWYDRLEDAGMVTGLVIALLAWGLYLWW